MKNLKYVILLVGLFDIAWMDVKEQQIPNRKLLKLFLCRIVFLCLEFFRKKELFFEAVLSVLNSVFVVSFVSLTIYFFLKKKIGGGDVKLLIMLSAYLEMEQMLKSFFCGFCYAAIFDLCRKCLLKGNKKQGVPLAPFVLMGVITQIWSNFSLNQFIRSL